MNKTEDTKKIIIKNVQVSGFKTLKNEFECPVEKDTTVIIGPNGVGKSSFLEALNWFFSSPTQKAVDLSLDLREEDCLSVTVEFSQIPGELLESLGYDTASSPSLSLSIRKTQIASDKVPFFETKTTSDNEWTKNKTKNKTKNHIKTELDKFVKWTFIPHSLDSKDLNPSKALEDFMEDILLSSSSWELEKMKGFYDINTSDRDEYILEIAKEIKAGLEKSLNSSTGRNSVEVTHVLSESIYKPVFKMSFGGLPINKLGTGLQRACLTSALVTTSSEVGSSNSSRTTVLAIEEPELYQHPVKIKHLAKVYRDWGTAEGRQMLYATHSPHFVSPSEIDKIRRFQLLEGKTILNSATIDEVIISHAKLIADNNIDNNDSKILENQRTKMNNFLDKELPKSFGETLFSNAVVLVEGDTDLAVIEELVGDFLEKSGVSLLSTGGIDGMPRIKAVLATFKIPYYTIIDLDGSATTAENSKVDQDGAANKKYLDRRRSFLSLPQEQPKSTFFAPKENEERGVAWQPDIESVIEQWEPFMKKFRDKTDNKNNEDSNTNILKSGKYSKSSYLYRITAREIIGGDTYEESLPEDFEELIRDVKSFVENL